MQPTSAAPELILVYGPNGGGKTHTWATLADWYRRTETPGTFYVISTERNAVARLSDAYPDFSNVVWRDILGWQQLVGLSDEYLQLHIKEHGMTESEEGSVPARSNDWLVIDAIDRPWDWAQTRWEEIVRGKKKQAGDPFLNDSLGLDAFEEEIEPNWQRINAAYYGWFDKYVRNWPGHVIATAPQKAIQRPNPKTGKGWSERKEIMDLYEKRGFRPAGQWALSYAFHTTLWMQNPRDGEWTMDMVDDHTRLGKWGSSGGSSQVVKDFVKDYLRDIAGWEVTTEDVKKWALST